MDILQGLSYIEKLESILAAMYEKLSVSFSSDAEASALFYQLHLDEITHRNLVQMQKRMVRNDPGSFSPEVSINMQEISSIMDTASGIASLKLPLEEVLGKSYMIENSTAELYVITAMRKSNKELARFLLQLGDTLRDHYSTLQSFIEKRGLDFKKIERESLRQARVPFNEHILIDNTFKLKAVDISKGGIFVLSEKSMKPGTIVSLKLPINNETLNIKAKVQYGQEKVGMGLMFMGLTEKQASRISAYIDKAFEELETLPEKENVLLVNSESISENNLRIFINALSENGFGILEVRGFAEATGALIKEKKKVKYILVSIDTETDNNLRLIRFLKRLPELKDIPVIVISTNYSPEFRKTVQAAGADRLLQKMGTSPVKLAKALRALEDNK